MANITKLREQARAYELKGQWAEAVDAYREILESAEGADVDHGLWNKIGDLHLRLNETDQAVAAYESAVSAYVDVGLYNNAIALCRKVLRLVPGRALTYLRLGQISAAKGFFADARQNFLEYADRMRRAGKLDASFDALKEFADLSPDDSGEIRRLLADQLLSHNRRDEAVEQLRILLAHLADRGDAAGAEAVRQQILSIDPTAPDTPLVRQRAQADDAFGGAFDTGDLPRPASPAAAPPAPSAPAPDRSTGHDVGATLDDYGAVELGEVAPLAGLETTSLGYDVDESPRGAAKAGEEAADDLPLLDMDAPPAPRAPASAPPAAAPRQDPARFGEISLDDAPLDWPGEDDDASPATANVAGDDDFDAGDDEPLPLLDAEPLPLLDVDMPPAPPARDRLEELRERVAASPEDAAAREELISLLHERGLAGEVPAVLEQAHRELGARGMYLDAYPPISALIRLRPGDALLLQKRVEYAFRAQDRDRMIEAYLALGHHMLGGGLVPKAEAVFRRVLELDPENAEAKAAVAQAAPQGAAEAAPPADAPAQPAPAADYIDLGELILGDEASREQSTRFVVEEKEPSGDEDKDFAEMLAHFRQKVAENIEAEDVGSHYDLGLAFKEMGLVDEAIAEFQVALRGGANPLATLELLGQCFIEKGQFAVASRVLDRALRIPGATDADLVGVLYSLGRVEESLGRPGAAVDFYERVLSVDIRFRDTGRRIEAIRTGSGAAPL